MMYFLLPRTYMHTYRHIEYIECENIPISYISNSLSYYLTNIKNNIQEYEYDWDTYKKITNPFEYIHTNVESNGFRWDKTAKGVSKYKPLSRSYFKMVEMVNFFELFPVSSGLGGNNEIADRIMSFHLAEGPGGFIEAFLRLRNNPLDKYIGMTILDNKNDHNIPSWKKSSHFMREHQQNVFIENGFDKTGNILNFHNFIYCVKKYGSAMDFITADGGFDFSLDFKNQENNIAQLLFAQTAFAVCMQKKGGNFILKIFDSFMIHTVDLLYLLSSFYEKVYICKPQTSRLANSEKYIVCKNFLFYSNHEFYPFFHSCFEKMVFANQAKKHVGRFLNIPITNVFITKLEEYNSVFGQQQIENISNTISLIKNKHRTEKIEGLIKMNLQRCLNWCIKYNVPYHMIPFAAAGALPMPSPPPPTPPPPNGINVLPEHIRNFSSPRCIWK